VGLVQAGQAAVDLAPGFDLLLGVVYPGYLLATGKIER
jgi:hypothetical protein